MADNNELQRVDSYQYPSAHIGHLTQGQSDALDRFKEVLAEGRYYNPGDRSKHIPASHDDETLLRYLRARKFLPSDAKQQFEDTERWREENKINEVYDTIDTKEYDETVKMYPQFTGRRDKRGIPVYVFQVADLNSKRMSEYEHSLAKAKSPSKTPVKLLRLFALYENLTRFVLPMCSGVPGRPFPETPVSQSSNIVDISGVGLKQFWNLKGHMQDASELATAHYPETLDRIFIIGAPSFFPTVWGWVKRWFDPVTVSKIFILSAADTKSTLERFIEPENIPKKYGGRLDWSWGQLPNMEPAIEQALSWKTTTKGPHGKPGFPMGPIRWIAGSDGGMEAVAVGSVNGKTRREVIATLPGRKAGLEIPVTPLAFENGQQLNETGHYSHPTENQQYFPSSGQTPPDEQDDPVRRASHIVPVFAQQSAAGHSSVRNGTSNTRYSQEIGTHAAGQPVHTTPDVKHYGYGDKTSTVETSTVGQAYKNVDVPYAQDSAPQTNGGTYLDQAKAMANSAYENTTAAVGAAGNTVMSAVGYGQEGSQEQNHQQQQPQQQKPVVPHDPRVDRLSQHHVEDFIRSQYTTSNNHGSNAQK